ncbi:hypothetical protein [Brevibacillus laterosporus]|uniref:hypothetical protein n=1 Tax=Brevibacillus laterosporus TaxID=1465 RepID=UPI0020CFDF29|nr:hypothetical protein [Brevibacillus laterosporus]
MATINWIGFVRKKTSTREQTYTYDERGNRQSILIAKSPTIADGSYTYDALNRLKTYAKNGQESTYTYYPGELRASKETEGKTTHCVYLNGNVIEELDERITSKPATFGAMNYSKTKNI